jgi:hypothetical protein
LGAVGDEHGDHSAKYPATGRLLLDIGNTWSGCEMQTLMRNNYILGQFTAHFFTLTFLFRL